MASLRPNDVDLDGITLRRIAYNGDLEETIQALTMEYLVDGLNPGDIVVINAFGSNGSPPWYQVTAEGNLKSYEDEEECVSGRVPNS